MAESNIIERTDNVDFNSPILVNKNGQRRLVFDLRALNANCVGKPCNYPELMTY